MTQIVFGWLPQPIGGMSVLQQGFVDSLVSFLAYDSANRNLFGGYTFASAGYIPAGRNTLVKTFLDRTEGEWLLQLDWDVSYGPLAVYQLLDAADPVERPVVSGCYVTYFGEDNLLRPCWMEERDGQEYVPVNEVIAGEVVPLTVCGMGFTLMHRDVLEALRKIHKDDPWHWFGHDHIGADRCGEDITFCSRVRAAGFSVWGHGGVMLGHTKAKMLTVSDLGDKAVGQAWPVNLVGLPQLVNKKVLNVGGGDKTNPLPEAYDGWHHVLLDITPGPGVDVVMDAREMDFEEQYDAVYSSHAIEHFEVHDVGRVLTGMFRALKPGGVADIVCPNYDLVFDCVKNGAKLTDIAYLAAAGEMTYGDILFGFSGFIDGGNDHYRHRTAISVDFLRASLTTAGFVDVQMITDEFNLHAMARKGA